MEVNLLTILNLVIFIFSKLFVLTAQEFSNGFCANPLCSEPVAFGVTVVNYNTIDKDKLSFIANQEVIIFVKESGVKRDLFGVMINGIRGYAHKSFVRETKTLIKDLVPASVNFMQPQFPTGSYHISSHVHVSSHLHHDDAHHSLQHSVPNIDPHSSHHFHQDEFHHLESSRQGDHIHPHPSSDDLYIVGNDESLYHASNQVPSSHVHQTVDYSMTLNNIPSHGEINSPRHFSQTPNSHQAFESQFQNPSEFQQSNQWVGANPDLSSSFSHGHISQSSIQGAFSDSQTNNNLDPQSNVLSGRHASQSFVPEANSQNLMQPSHSQSYEVHSRSQIQPSHSQSFVPEANAQNQFSHSQSHIPEANAQFQMQFPQPQIAESNTQNQMQFSPSQMAESNTPNQMQFPHSQSHMPSENIPSQMQSASSESYMSESSTHSQMQPSQSFYSENQESRDQDMQKTLAMLKDLGYDEDDLTEESTKENNQDKLISSNQNVPSEQLMTDSQSVPHSDVVSSMDGPNPISQINPSSTFHSESSQQMSGSEFIKSTSDVSQPSEETKKSSFVSDTSQTVTAKFNEKVEAILKSADEFEEKELKQKEMLNNDYSNEIIESNKNIDATKRDFPESTHQSDMPMNQEKEPLAEKVQEKQEDLLISDDKENFIPNLSQEDSTSPSLISDSGSDNADSLVKDSEESEVKSNIEIETNTIESNNLTSNILDRSGDLVNDNEENVSTDELEQPDDNTIEDENSEEVEDFSFEGVEDSTHGPSNSTDGEAGTDSLNIETNSEFITTTKNSDVSNINSSDTVGNEDAEGMSAYQTRHLKDFENNNENAIPIEENEQIGGSWEFNIYASFENSLDAIRSFIEVLLPWIPDPLYTIITDLEKEGISPKVPVFTVLSAVPCIVLMVLLVYIKEKSKEKKLIAKLTISEKTLYNLMAEKNIFEEKLEKAEIELQILRTLVEEEKLVSAQLKVEVDSLKEQGEEANIEIDKSIDTIEGLKERELQYVQLVKDHEKEHLNLLKEKTALENELTEEKNTITILTEQLEEKNTEIEKLLEEKSEGNKTLEDYQEKLSLLQQNCNQLLQEAEVWNLRVKELSDKLSEESSLKGELEESLKEKNNEIEALTEAIQVFKSFEEIGKDEKEDKSIEEKLQYIINSTSILIKLQKQEEDNRLLSERLDEEKNKLIDMEVTILDIKSENDKLRLNYNQALQDKAEAQTKLDVLTNYFKDKEIQLQKQLGVQEAVRQKTEEDASSAERRICLIEQENSSYKYQVATMKQEMEETERNLKSQIASQEKKAHENWLAARTAERKLEDTKQEVMQLRQRLTLLEREQENWLNSTRDEIIRPVPKRIANANDDTVLTQDSSSSVDLRPPMFPPPPMMLPSDRPLPPLPPLPPPYLPPFEPPPPHFRPQPWLPPPDSISNSEYRMTPEFGRGRESTPPRGRNSVGVDGDMGPRQSSPITDMRDSRNSTPPHLLPDFHDIPPHPPRPPFFPPMGPRTRFPPPPGVFRRDHLQGQRRHENQDDNPNYGPQHQTGPPDNWRNPRV